MRCGWAIAGLVLVGSGCASSGDAAASTTTWGAPDANNPAPPDPIDDDSGGDTQAGTGESGADAEPEPDDDSGDPPEPDGGEPPPDGDGIPAAVCGDGLAEGNEACDDGNGIDFDACKSDCTPNVCGDGFVFPGVELCDDGNNFDNDECTNTCTLTSCGDGVVQAGEECDDGNPLDNDACLSTCVQASCGDGQVWSGMEDCDDANDADDDDCIACANAFCGDGFVHENDEICDPSAPGVGCGEDCEIETVDFSYGFPAASPDAASCTGWNTFRSELATNHTLVTVSGSNSPGGRTCTGAGATTICAALRNGTEASVFCDGHNWHVGTCNGPLELTVDGTACACHLDGFAVRPCHITAAFGGLESHTCYAGPQTIDVTCSYQ
ncbi:MAG: DUF4215 domain-containing protein [Myxococcota bacterium]